MGKRIVGAAVAGLTLVGVSGGIGIAAATAQSGTPAHSGGNKTVKTVATKSSAVVPTPAVVPQFLGSAGSTAKTPTTKPKSSSGTCPDMGSGTGASGSGSSGSSSSHTSTSATASSLS